MWELVRKRQQYQHVRKPKVADSGMDTFCADRGTELQTTLPTPIVTIHSLRERLNPAHNPHRQTLQEATPLTVLPNTKLDLKKVNGDVCLLTDSPYRILRVSDSKPQ
jgi:hypothetical protein